MVTLREDGAATFEVYLPQAKEISIVGDFTSSMEHGLPMTPSREPEYGWWRARLPLSEGEHSFSYLVDGACWLPDYAAAGIQRNRDGRWVSLLTVPAQRTAQAVRLRPDREPVVRNAQRSTAFSWAFSNAGQNERLQTP